MTSSLEFLTRRPGELTEPEIQDFIAMVRKGGEVGGVVLEANVRNAECLLVARRASYLVAVAALKIPKITYRTKIGGKSGVTVSSEAFPFELGYLFVLPIARNQGIGRKLCEDAVHTAASKGVFATARTDNQGMHAILSAVGFSKAGEPYTSGRGSHRLQLFLRPASPQPDVTDGHAKRVRLAT